MEAMSFVTEDRKTAQESTFPNTHTFDLFGGVDVSLTLLMPEMLCILYLNVEVYLWRVSVTSTVLALNFPVSLKLLVEILMRPTLTMQKKKTKSKQY